jgi:2-polyprenyl-6-methoxyphenol hydroxylase-like FAD-dependent oxidoreductase
MSVSLSRAQSASCLPSLAIAGLSMAIGLAMSGHSVRVLEKSPRFGKPPGGIRLPPNVTKILVQWGLEDELRKRGSLVREASHIWDCKSFHQCAPFFLGHGIVFDP